MSVKSTFNNEKSELTLILDNGDLKKLNDVMKKYSFKDYQSFIRFAVSLLLLNENENKSVSIKMNGISTDVVPSDDLISKDDNNGSTIK